MPTNKEWCIGTVTINRSEKPSATDTPTRKALGRAFENCETDDDGRVVVLRGAGDGSVIAGSDIDMLQRFDATGGLEFAKRHTQGQYNDIAAFPKPTIAAIDGYVLGGGTEIAIACDIRIATETAKICLPEA